MIVPINKQYRIITDPYQWIVQKKRARKDKDGWESVTYHPTFPSAFQSLGELMVRRSDAATLADALVDVENVTTSLSQALRPYFEHGLELKAGPPIVTLKKGVEKGLPNV